MATAYTNGALTVTWTMTTALASRLVNGVLASNGISTTAIDNNGALTQAQKNQAKMDLFDAWLRGYLRSEVKSIEGRQAGATAAATADTELPV